MCRALEGLQLGSEVRRAQRQIICGRTDDKPLFIIETKAGSKYGDDDRMSTMKEVLCCFDHT